MNLSSKEPRCCSYPGGWLKSLGIEVNPAGGWAYANFGFHRGVVAGGNLLGDGCASVGELDCGNELGCGGAGIVLPLSVKGSGTCPGCGAGGVVVSGAVVVLVGLGGEYAVAAAEGAGIGAAPGRAVCAAFIAYAVFDAATQAGTS